MSEYRLGEYWAAEATWSRLFRRYIWREAEIMLYVREGDYSESFPQWRYHLRLKDRPKRVLSMEVREPWAA